MNYVCRNCHSINYECHMDKEVVSDPFCTGDSPSEVIIYCPTCHSDDVEEATMCLTCGEGIAEDGYDDCQKCINEEEESNVT